MKLTQIVLQNWRLEIISSLRRTMPQPTDLKPKLIASSAIRPLVQLLMVDEQNDFACMTPGPHKLTRLLLCKLWR